MLFKFGEKNYLNYYYIKVKKYFQKYSNNYSSSMLRRFCWNKAHGIRTTFYIYIYQNEKILRLMFL